jgi:hypothetical protein
MIVPSQLALKTHTNFGSAASIATLDKLVDRFPLPPISLPIGGTILGPTNRYSNKIKGMWPSCVERYTRSLFHNEAGSLPFLIQIEKQKS